MPIRDYMKNANLKFNGKLRPRTVTNGIVLHHAAVQRATPQQIHEWHLQRGWLGAGYNVYVRKDGSVWELRPLWAVGAHAEGVNSESIGVCAEGMYHSSDSQPYDREMPRQQFDALVKVVKDLVEEYPSIMWIKGHNEVQGSATACPGSFFPLQEVIRTATNSLAVKEVDVMKKGDRGPVVEKLQRLLIELGYELPKYGIDGVFGVETEAAVNAFKKLAGLPQNGTVDVTTMIAMAERLLQSKKALKQENADLQSRIQAIEKELKKTLESTNAALEKCRKECEERNKGFVEFFRLLNQLINEVGEQSGV
ncbi:peptidoglycan-binding domain-containing protein [Caldicoprobacter algeriensis]|uniref:peptidoglycan recognition protein family protein n=1 Tax=Caldicoprobacter algeriensis TaxID=699281 RepID=UPI00207A30A6|nr:peptidoglycan-binding domain-containing protein [Caldicoprobacter algeriensis]MCM8901276.1 peptidoglycan-binding domain-containing protein [Caldicoprobacter algeriensis]